MAAIIIPSIEQPTQDVRSLQNSIVQLKEAIEIMAGVRGPSPFALADAPSYDDEMANTLKGKYAWEIIEQGAFNTVASKNFLNLGAFRELRMSLHIIPVSAATGVLYMRYSTNNGSSFVGTAGEYYNNLLYNTEASGTPVGAATTNTYWDLSFSNAIAINPYGITVKQHISGFNKPQQTKMAGSLDFYNGSDILHGWVHHRSGTTSLMNALHIAFVGDVITFTGTYLLEGVRG